MNNNIRYTEMDYEYREVCHKILRISKSMYYARGDEAMEKLKKRT